LWLWTRVSPTALWNVHMVMPMCDLRIPSHRQHEFRHSARRDACLNTNETRAVVYVETID